MRVLVCGGRTWGWAHPTESDYRQRLAARQRAKTYSVLDAFHNREPIDVVINGDARGADRLSSKWATHRGVPVARYPANWKHEGRAAGPIRNQRMLDIGRPDIVVAFPGGHGTADMVARAYDAGVRVFDVRLDDE